MNISGLWILGLIVWLLMLQSRIKGLEELVNSLKKSVFDLETDKYDQGAIAALKKGEESVEKVAEDMSKTVVLEEEIPNETDKVILDESTPEDIGLKQYQESTNPEPMIAYKKTTEHYEYQAPESSKPSEPSWIMQMLTSYFTGGNILVRIGGVILFFGLAFLVKYAAEHSVISIELRLFSVALVAIGLIVLGWRLRAKEGAYGEILQGLGVAILYLVIYGASKFYSLLSLEFAFVWMLVVVILGSFLALKQKSLPLALFSTTGGFLVPILTSTGQGSHVILFSYYFFLNLGIFFMAWKQAWRLLNIVGFLFTFVIATSWGVLRYSPELFATTEPFLILYFVMYLAITILFSRKSTKHLVDGTLLFGLPAVVFPLQTQLVTHTEYGAGISAVVMGTLYLFLSKVLKDKIPSQLLLQGFLGLGVLFYTVAIPYFFDADITAAIWAMESSAVIWLALKQQRVFVRYFGELLLFISVGLYLLTGLESAMNFSLYLGYMIVAVATLFAGYQLERNKEYLGLDSILSTVYLALSFMVWMVSVYRVSSQITSYELIHKILLGFVFGAVLFALIERYFRWKVIVISLQATLPVGVLLFAFSLVDAPMPINPFSGLGVWVFLTLTVCHTVMLYRYDEVWSVSKYLHILSLWFVVGVLSMELHYVVTDHGGSDTLRLFSLAIMPLLATFALMKGNLDKIGLREYTAYYRSIGVGGLLLLLSLWEGVALFYRADSMTLGAVPVLNPLDMMQIAVCWMMVVWVRYHQREEQFGLPLYGVAVAVATAIFARAFAHYGGLPYQFVTLWKHYYFQIGVVLLWAMLVLLSLKAHKHYEMALYKRGSHGLLFVLLLWQVRAFAYAADFLGSYFPIFNLLDMTQIGLLGLVGYRLYTFREDLNEINRDVAIGAMGFLAFVLLSVVFARGVHLYRAVPYHLGALWSDPYFQTGLSLLWSAVAIVLMFLSKRYMHRLSWLAGFGLLGFVVLKLFFVELANSGTIERIVSFMVVGALLLLIGYFVPMPPSKDENHSEKAEQ